MKKFLALALALAMSASMLAGCANNSASNSSAPSSGTPSSSAPSGEGGGSTIQIAKEDLKVGLVLPGSINDQGWSTSAYLGLQAIEEDYGCETTYMENVTVASYEESFRSLASAGYNVIFGHGSEFFDAAEIVGAEFPDVAFIVTSTDRFAAPNVASVNTLPTEMGYIGGVGAALATNPDIKVLTNMTGDDFDAAKCKEVAQAMIDQGADVIFYDADAAGLGALEACQENGVMAIPAIADASELAPDTVLMSACNAIGQAMDTVVGYIVDGTFTGQFYPMGCDTGCVYYTTNDPVWNANMTEENQAKVEEVYQQLVNKEIDVDAAIASVPAEITVS